MAEVRKVRANGFKAISTFSGCGGSSLGYRMAGFRVLWASEFVEAARDTYRANARKDTILDGRDIRTVDPLEVLKTLGLKPGELDLLDGSPPCASFSTAGKRQKSWGKVKKYSDKSQRSDDLFHEFVRFVDVIQPKTFVGENVSGLVKGVAKGYFIQILAALKAAGPGYNVEARLLDAQWLGVPQQRQRIIFVGVRKDLGLKPAFPKPLPYRYSIREALPWLDSVVHDTSGLYGAGEVIDRPSPAVTVGVHSVNSLHFKARGKLLQGPEVDQRNAGKAIDVRKPSPAIMAGNAAKRTPRQFQVQVGANAGFGKESWNSIDGPVKTIGASPQSGNGRVGSGEIRIIPGAKAGQRRRGNKRPDSADEPAPTIMGLTGHGETQFRVEAPPVEPESDISRFAIGAEWEKIGPGGQTYYGGRLSRGDPDKPSLTVSALGGVPSASSVTHPFERRKFSIGELRRLCGFPDDFILTGTYGQQWERLGRAVPPVMMRAIAETIRDEILRKL